MYQIAIIGDSEASDKVLSAAEEIGELLAKEKVCTLSGGRSGVMEAAFKGAKKNGGLTVAILPTNDKGEANNFSDVKIVTNMGWTRNSIIQLSADGVIVIGGRSGTLSEIAFAWMYDKPIVALVSAGGWGEKLAGTKIDDRRTDVIEIANTPQEAVSKILSLLQKK
ncbi:MAG: TIGR00725 family protein [Candidatus Ranarchaeia archaeon]